MMVTKTKSQRHLVDKTKTMTKTWCCH